MLKPLLPTLASLLMLLPILRADDALPPRPKQVFAHYMGCWPIGTGPLYYQRHHLDENFRADVERVRVITNQQGKVSSFINPMYYGDHVRNYPLIEPNQFLTPAESADLEIRRAMRIGIDGFSVDAWAGGKVAQDTLDTLFKVAEEKNYPFYLTICVDPNCGGNIVKSVKELLAKHGTSPKLARRDGKPLIFGYQSIWETYAHLLKMPGMTQDKLQQLRTTPAGWNEMGEAFAEAQKEVGQPIFYEFGLSAFFYNVNGKVRQANKASLVDAAGVIAKRVPAVGSFTGLGKNQGDVAQAVRAAGAEWVSPVGMYQKENIPWELYAPKGTEWLSGCWQNAIKEDSTLIQLITWNDYGEDSNIAPGYDTRYALYDLTGYYIQLWKTGSPPPLDHDRLYLVYHKYPKDAPVFPFHSFEGLGNIHQQFALEVVTILTQPAHVTLPGRNLEFDAPAGFHREQFPLTAGPVVANLTRDGKTVIHLDSPEPVTDKPFRPDNGLVCFCSEDARLWKEDFGDTPPFWYSEYGDVNHNGLPNWFEMYWFGKWFDFLTMTNADPNADSNGNGKTNLQEYEAQRAPVTLPPLTKLGHKPTAKLTPPKP